MRVVLKEDIENLGKKGDIEEVSNGYARNFLIPKELVEVATDATIKLAEKLKKQREEEEAKKIAELEKVAEGVKDISIEIKQKTKEDGSLFGSVKAENIVEELNKKSKSDFMKEMIMLDEPIKKVGDYKVKVKISKDLEIEINVKVSKEK